METTVLSYCTTATPPPSRTQSKVQKKGSSQKVTNRDIALQNAYMARHMVQYILKEEGISVSGLLDGFDRNPVVSNDAKFLEARRFMERMCTSLRIKHGDEVSQLVGQLDISDSELYGEFHKGAVNIIYDGITPGRVAALFLFAGMFAIRLHGEGRQYKKMQSLTEWLNDTLNDHLTEWLQDHNGWVRILCCIYCALFVGQSLNGSQALLSTWCVFTVLYGRECKECFSLICYGHNGMVVAHFSSC